MVKQFPLWTWWAIGLSSIAASAAVAAWLVGGRGPVLPPSLVEKREAVSQLLEAASHIEDVAIEPLVVLEGKKDFNGAVALMERALSANLEQERLNASLVTLSEELARLAIGVKPDEVGTKAVEAFGLLAKLAKAEKKFFEDRRLLYELTLGYYADLVAKKKPLIPDSLGSMVDAVNDDLEKTKALHQRFTAAVKAFDEAIDRK